MKKLLSTAVIVFSFLLNNVFAGNVLLLTNPESRETNVFRKGSYIVFELEADRSIHEGFIRDIMDSSLVFDNSQVSLSQIHVFAGNTKARIVAGKVANAVGNTLLFAGATMFNCGTNLILYNDYYYWPIGGTVWLAGAFIAGLGYTFDWALCSHRQAVRVRNYRGWGARIVGEGQIQGIPEKQISRQRDSTQTATTPEIPEKEKRNKRKTYGDDVYGE